MGLITDPYNFSVGQVADGDQVDARFSVLYGEVNGNLDATNLKDGAVPLVKTGVAATGLAQGSFSAYRSANKPITGGNAVVADFNSEDFDVGSSYDATTGVYTPPMRALYEFGVHLTMLAMTDGTRAFALLETPAGTALREFDYRRAAATDDLRLVGSIPIVLDPAAGDAVRLRIQHDDGTNVRNLLGGNGYTGSRFWGRIVGRM